MKKLGTVLDVLLVVGAAAVFVAWLIGSPILYSDTKPVMSAFTAFSLVIMALVRLARTHLWTWPLSLSLAMTLLVLCGNFASIVMLTSMPAGLLSSFSEIVVTSVMTSVGLMFFCAYEVAISLRDTPRAAFVVDDVFLHLALVPGGLSLLGYLLDNPGYLSIDTDPRIGISPLEMVFMGTYAVNAVVSNPRLFLWQFLAASWTNRAIFAALFANQFVAPIVVAYLFREPHPARPGIELFVMLGGVLTTMAFLIVEGYLRRRTPSVAAETSTSTPGS